MNNRKRTNSRNIQTIVCSKTVIRDKKEVKNPDAGKLKQIKHLGIPPDISGDCWGISKAKEFEKAILEKINERYL